MADGTRRAFTEPTAGASVEALNTLVGLSAATEADPTSTVTSLLQLGIPTQVLAASTDATAKDIEAWSDGSLLPARGQVRRIDEIRYASANLLRQTGDLETTLKIMERPTRGSLDREPISLLDLYAANDSELRRRARTEAYRLAQTLFEAECELGSG